MSEQQLRALIDRFTKRAAWHRDAVRRCTYPEAAFVNDGWAAGLEEASIALVELLDGPQAAHAFREQLTGRPETQRVQHLSEKNPNVREAS